MENVSYFRLITGSLFKIQINSQKIPDSYCVCAVILY